MNFFKSKKFEKIKKISKFGKSYTDFLYLTKIKRIDNKNLGIWTKNKLIESGTTFIKIGQLISTRSDLFDKDFLFELKGLQDNILPIPFEQLEYFILPIKSELEYIDPNQIASASIGQVHKAILKNGDKIVIKFKRPNIEKKIHEDFEFLLGIIKFIKNISNDRKINEFEILFNEYYLLLKEEINFNLEASNMIKFKENFKDINFVKVPKLYNKLSNNNIIVMEYVPSIKIDNLEELDKLNFNKKKISTKLIELFIMQVIDHGFVHIDPHPGNIGISMDGQIVFYDFGIILNIDKNIKENFNQLIIAIINKNINKICEISINMGLIIIEKEDIIYFKKFLISFLIYVENSNIEDFKINYIDKLSLNDTAWLGSKWKLFSYFNVQYGS